MILPNGKRIIVYPKTRKSTCICGKCKQCRNREAVRKYYRKKNNDFTRI